MLLIAVVVIVFATAAIVAFGIGILYYPSELQQIVLIGGLIYLAAVEIVTWIRSR